MKPRKIALIGERDLAKRAHLGIEAALAYFQSNLDPNLAYSWVGTRAISAGTVDGLLQDATGVWCVPGSPYESTEGALLAIRHARCSRKAFLGTCAGFQHALMEYARNVLHHQVAHQELDPAAENPLIIKLSCSLVGVKGKVIATDAERFAGLLGGPDSTEEFHCNYGFNGDLAGIFHGSDLRFVAHDELGQVRAFRLEQQPFYIGTLFQPERRVFGGTLHPLVEAFLRAA